jgi:hypothetical protein
MKRRMLSSKLKLTRETLRSLATPELRRARGGDVVNPTGLSCIGTCPVFPPSPSLGCPSAGCTVTQGEECITRYIACELD